MADRKAHLKVRPAYLLIFIVIVIDFFCKTCFYALQANGLPEGVMGGAINLLLGGRGHG
jgi:Na+/glutamate symporter